MAKFTKIFTFFDSAADLFRQIAYLPQKDFYELIEADRWAKLYFDIEHYVDSEAVPSGIEGAVQVIKEQLILTWPDKFQNADHVIEDVIILIASRHVDSQVDGCNVKYNGVTDGMRTGKYDSCNSSDSKLLKVQALVRHFSTDLLLWQQWTYEEVCP